MVILIADVVVLLLTDILKELLVILLLDGACFVVTTWLTFAMAVLVADVLVLLLPDILELLVILLDRACCRHLYGAVSSMPSSSVFHTEQTGIPHCLFCAISNEQT
jgi:hypothetical protein